MHTLPEVDRVEYFDPISEVQKRIPAFADDPPFRIRDHETDRAGLGAALQEVWLEPEPGLAGA